MRVRAWPRLPRRQRLSRALSAVAGGPVAELLLPRVHTALSRDIGAMPGQRLVVSVSGGCDSVALLHLLLALQPRWRLRLHVLHFNHGLRPESGDEEAFVHALAERHSLPVHVRRLPAGWRESQPGGIQERSREWRRAESLALLDELDAAGPPHPSSADADDQDEPGAASLVALAHHADDQAETVLLKALRGCHLSNLRGMESRAGRFVRPLLGVRKEELSAYLGALGEGWKEDATNAEPTYKRNRIRLQLLPLLEELAGGGLLERLGAASEQSAQLREWLDQAHAAHVAADPAWERSGGRALSVAPLLAAQTMVQEELLHRLARGASVGRLSLTQDALRRVRAQLVRSRQEWVLELSGGWLLRRTGATVSIAGAEAAVAELAVGEAGVRLRHPAELAVRAGVARGPRAELPPGALALRLGGLGGERELTLREWRRGDRFHPQGRRAPVSLSHFLRGLDVPLDERRRAPLLCLPNSSTVVAVCRPAHVGSGFEVAAPSPGAEAAAEEPCLWVQILDQ
mmetsp:Transcript_20812/g.70434  ORF Transcript_20812/g.70434 Transcript_20812/m.70434 type:complete len:517 (+) Transcript_20812:166-1716(+)